MVLTYLDGMVHGELEFKQDLLWWQREGLQYTATGYGSKMPTERKVRYNNRWYRVYCTVCSNIGSLYIISKEQKLYIK